MKKAKPEVCIVHNENIDAYIITVDGKTIHAGTGFDGHDIERICRALGAKVKQATIELSDEIVDEPE